MICISLAGFSFIALVDQINHDNVFARPGQYSVASLESPEFSLAEPHCLSFAYFYYVSTTFIQLLSYYG